MLHGYCIRSVGDPGPERDLTGVDRQPVTRVDAGPLQMWVSPGVEHGVTVDRLREHERVVRTALRTATPLPLRFGTRFGSEADAKAALIERDKDFIADLERLRDTVEMSVRISVTSPSIDEKEGGKVNAPAASSPGRAFLERRKSELEGEAEERGRAERILSEVEAELRDLGLPTVRTLAPTGVTIGSLAHLVHKGRLRPYRQKIEDLRRERGDLRIELSGPWAPYSFV